MFLYVITFLGMVHICFSLFLPMIFLWRNYDFIYLFTCLLETIWALLMQNRDFVIIKLNDFLGRNKDPKALWALYSLTLLYEAFPLHLSECLEGNSRFWGNSESVSFKVRGVVWGILWCKKEKNEDIGLWKYFSKSIFDDWCRGIKEVVSYLCAGTEMHLTVNLSWLETVLQRIKRKMKNEPNSEMLNPHQSVHIQRKSNFCDSFFCRKYSCRGRKLLKYVFCKKFFTLELLMFPLTLNVLT